MSNYSYLTGNVTWLDGAVFNGFCILSLLPPKTTNGTPRTLFCGKTQIPLETRIPIKDGVFDQTRFLYTADINPPNSRYVIRYYDESGALVGAPDDIQDAFIVSSPTTTPPIYINETSNTPTDI